MIKNNESFDNLINYFDSEQYKQLLKGFISVSETAESLLDKFSFNILDSMTSALINISKSFEQRQSKILFDSLEILKNVPLDSLDWNSSSNREVQLDDKSVERVSDVLDTVIPDDVPKKKSLEETLKKHQATTAFIFGLLIVDLAIFVISPKIKFLKQSYNIELLFASVPEHLIPTEKEWNNLDAIETLTMIGYPNGIMWNYVEAKDESY